jgi:hypothetical protein
MKRMILIMLLVIPIVVTVNAQKIPTVNTGKANVGQLLSQFAGAIKPASFLSSWTAGKSGWLSKAAKVADASGLAGSVSSLAGFIKPGMFKNGFSLKNLQQAATTAKTMGEATNLLKDLEGGIKPEAMTSGWNDKRTGWLSALSLIK